MSIIGSINHRAQILRSKLKIESKEGEQEHQEHPIDHHKEARDPGSHKPNGIQYDVQYSGYDLQAEDPLQTVSIDFIGDDKKVIEESPESSKRDGSQHEYVSEHCDGLD